MSYHRGPLEPGEVKRLKAGATPERMQVRVLPLMVPEEDLMREAERKRAKGGILSGAEEKAAFAKTFYLPYLDFSYEYSAKKGFLSKQTVLNQGRSALLALREADLGFDPSLVELAPQLVEAELDSDSIIRGVDSTTLVQERLDDLRRLLSDYEKQLEGLRGKKGAVSKDDPKGLSLKDHIEHLEEARSSRWRIFADGLKLPSKTDPSTLELLEGGLLYIPYFIVKLSRGGESRFLVRDRRGKENDTIADELMKNKKFRELIESRATSQ